MNTSLVQLPQRMNAAISFHHCTGCGRTDFVVELKREGEPQGRLCTLCLDVHLASLPPRHRLDCDALASGETCGLQVRPGDLDCSCGAGFLGGDAA